MTHDNENRTVNTLPLIALRGLVMFPGMLLHFDAGREKSIAALNAAMAVNKEILLVAQNDIMDEDPKIDDLYSFGCTAKIRQMLKVSENEVRVLVEGVRRVYLCGVNDNTNYLLGDFFDAPDSNSRATVIYKQAAIRHIKNMFDEYARLVPRLSKNIVMSVRAADDIGYLANYIASNLPFEVEDKQAVLEERNPVKRSELIAGMLEREIELTSIDAKISEKVKVQMDANQREYYMREQLKALNEELYGESNPHEESDELKAKIKSLNVSSDVADKLLKEVDKLEKMPFGSQEASVIRNYLDVCISLPFGSYTKDNINIKRARTILEREHYGLEKVKERIIETLAVHSLTGSTGGSILCLVGPPGVGKTSIARSVANCMDRRFARISLGGVHDEAEIRGHRRTYIGSMPGRIIDAIKLAGSANPVILLDEVDKLAADYKGDPSSALLEALDPEQNSTFKDHFLDIPFDLSKVFFITTANNIDAIPGPLRDRMEIIELSGYTKLDKMSIAKKYLVKKQLEKNGVNAKNCKISSGAISDVIDYYTREAGVRKLEQSIATVCRKVATKVVAKEAESVSVTAQNLQEFLGTPRFKDEALLPQNEVGVVNGLAYTQVGGTLMQLEASVIDGSGKLELTGSLGDVMRESAKTALSYVRSIADTLGVDKDFYKNKDFHINATESAIPKDGPSAGITMVTALVSALTGIPIKRDVAMTGEITLRGRVLAIGGLKEKTMAAYSSGVKTVFIPKANEQDLEDIDKTVRENLRFIPVTYASEVIELALAEEIKKPSEERLIPQMHGKINRTSTRQ